MWHLSLSVSVQVARLLVWFVSGRCVMAPPTDHKHNSLPNRNPAISPRSYTAGKVVFTLLCQLTMVGRPYILLLCFRFLLENAKCPSLLNASTPNHKAFIDIRLCFDIKTLLVAIRPITAKRDVIHKTGTT